jgi:RNA polymerase sigma-70 factor (ECF subfamily)
MLFQRSDEELIRLACSGDGGAFTDLIRPHYLSAFRVAFGLLHDRGEAEDAVQEAAFKAWRKLDTVRAGAPLRPWFLAIVGNHCKSVRRKGWWSTPPLEVERGSDATRDLDAHLDLRRALRRLDHDKRLILVLRYYLDMPYDEIAQTMGITAKAARTRVERAIHRLRPIFPVREAVT